LSAQRPGLTQEIPDEFVDDAAVWAILREVMKNLREDT
jgi:hypothetical protein